MDHLECPICLTVLAPKWLFVLDCNHIYCLGCLVQLFYAYIDNKEYPFKVASCHFIPAN